MRSTFIKTLVNLAKNDERVFLITPDLGFSVLEEFEKKFPNRFLNVGIAEQNAVGIASGLALSGKIVYVYSIIPFITMRAFEQVRVDVAYMNTNVRLVGVGAGLSYGAAGATHHSIEDIAIMQALPNMTVFSPCDPYEIEELTKKSINYKGPIYFRLAKNGEPIISNRQNKLKLGKLNYIKKTTNSNIAILFTGNVSSISLDVFNALNDRGLAVDLVSAHTIKPFSYEELSHILASKQYIFTIEEHSLIGGLGSIVALFIAQSTYSLVFKSFALPDMYSHYVGTQEYIREKLGFTSQNILNNILKVL